MHEHTSIATTGYLLERRIYHVELSLFTYICIITSTSITFYILSKLEMLYNVFFPQMTRVLDILEDFMFHMNFGYERIDGNITGSLRQAAIDRFNSEDSDRFVV